MVNVSKAVNSNVKTISGRFEEHDAQGHLIRRFCLLDDQLHGVLETFYENGKPAETLSYENGCLEGPAVFYEEDGQIRQQLSFQKNHLNGEAIIFNKGVMAMKTFFKDDQQEGAAYFYNEAGVVTNIAEYRQGKFHGEFKTFDQDGHLLKLECYKNGLKEGASITFYPGKMVILEEAPYKDNKLHGTLVKYYEEGGIKEERLFYEGKLVEKPTFYNKNGKEIFPEDA